MGDVQMTDVDVTWYRNGWHLNRRTRGVFRRLCKTRWVWKQPCVVELLCSIDVVASFLGRFTRSDPNEAWVQQIQPRSWAVHDECISPAVDSEHSLL